jgi:hypothetical protein
MEKMLHNELLAAQKAQIDLIKWKIILIAPIGATGLGLTSVTKFPGVEWVLCILPLLCFYVDLAYYQQSLIIYVISTFYRLQEKDKQTFHEYEEFSHNVKELGNIKWQYYMPRYNDFRIREFAIGAYDFNYVILSISSYFISILLIIYSMWILNQGRYFVACLILFSGLFGLISTYISKKAYRVRKERIDEKGKTF